LKTVMIRSTTWDYVTNNDYVVSGAGIANPPFKTFERQVGTNPDGSPFMARFGTLTKTPGILYMINDEGLDIGNPDNASWAYHIEDGKALFLPDITNDLFEGCIANEPIIEYDNGPETMKSGLASWTTRKSNPSSYEAFVLDNFFPVPYNPGTWAYGTVSGF
jgi:hypothetical protein